MNKHTPGPTYRLTTINVQGEEQAAFEVYADASKEQTIGFVFDEPFARTLASAPTLAADNLRLLAALTNIEITGPDDDDLMWLRFKGPERMGAVSFPLPQAAIVQGALEEWRTMRRAALLPQPVEKKAVNDGSFWLVGGGVVGNEAQEAP